MRQPTPEMLHFLLMLSYCGTDVYYMMKSQMKADATLIFHLEGHLEGNEGKTIFSFDIHINQK